MKRKIKILPWDKEPLLKYFQTKNVKFSLPWVVENNLFKSVPQCKLNQSVQKLAEKKKMQRYFMMKKEKKKLHVDKEPFLKYFQTIIFNIL